ncbi:hypothetical protein FRC00_005889 [Tulasnella sp. 408]|nr:hypothetical protein FRC00_005889 [Tulasnella sp. 408]
MSSFSDLQGLHSQSLLGTTPHGGGAFDAAAIFDFNFGSAMGGGSDLSSGGGPPGSSGVPPQLLSSTEETSLLGFLDKFSGDGFEFGPVKGMPEYPKHLDPPPGLGIVSGQGAASSNHYGGLALDFHPLQMHQSSSSTASGHDVTPTTISPHETSNLNTNAFALRPHSSSFSQPRPPTASVPVHASSSPAEVDPSPCPAKRRKSSVMELSSKDADASPPTTSASASSSKASRKLLLTEPQKRWNHIQSEQRRRTVIKENFSTLETLVAADKRYKGRWARCSGRPSSLHIWKKA